MCTIPFIHQNVFKPYNIGPQHVSQGTVFASIGLRAVFGKNLNSPLFAVKMTIESIHWGTLVTCSKKIIKKFEKKLP